MATIDPPGKEALVSIYSEGPRALCREVVAARGETWLTAEDPPSGPLVTFGLGGVDTELVREMVFRRAPLLDRDADALMQSARGYPLLQGHRGRPPADLDALRDVILRVSLLGDRIPEVRELDLNPVMALPAGHGCRVIDARARVGPASRQDQMA